jgi:hypothetical protein
MLDRAEPPEIQAFASHPAPPLPGWARPVNPPETEAEAAFLAGAALARLDALMHENPAGFGVWRQRLTLEAAAACAQSQELAPFASARCYRTARRALTPAGAAGELLAAGLADSVLALKLKWPFALPLTGGPQGVGRRVTGRDDASAAVLLAYAHAATRAADLAADLARRACKLAQVAPKLRAKGAATALQALLDEDSLSAATPIVGLSERGARRLFERLVSLDAVRELTGRATFRLYGL